MEATLETVIAAKVPRFGNCKDCPFCTLGPGPAICLVQAGQPMKLYELGIPNLQRPGRRPDWCPLNAGKIIVELA